MNVGPGQIGGKKEAKSMDKPTILSRSFQLGEHNISHIGNIWVYRATIRKLINRTL